MKTAIVVIAVSSLVGGIASVSERQTSYRPSPEVSTPSARGKSQADDELAGQVTAPGRTQPMNQVAIRSTVSLRVLEVPIKEGDRVTKGGSMQGSVPAPASVLAKLDDGDLQAALQAAEAKRDAAFAEIEVAQVRLAAQQSQVASSRVCLSEAERSWGRFRNLVNTECVSQSAADEANYKYERLKAEHEAAIRGHDASRAQLAVLRQNLKAAELGIERARLALAAATLISPIDGVITRLNVKVGEVVTGTISNPGTVLMEIADMDHMLMIVHLDEASIAKVQVGQKALVRLNAYPQDVFQGTVAHLALTSTDENPRGFKAEILLDTQGRLIQAGLGGEARIETQSDAARQ
ncbi:MAG: HlyD family secretion protein [Bacillota bacterium]